MTVLKSSLDTAVNIAVVILCGSSDAFEFKMEIGLMESSSSCKL